MWEYPSIVPGQDAGVARTPSDVIGRYRNSLLRQKFEPFFGKNLKLYGSLETGFFGKDMNLSGKMFFGNTNI